MNRVLKVALPVHFVLSFILGAVMLVVPGRLLDVLNWWPIDPIMGRLVGAALLALAWGDWRTWRAGVEAQTRLWVEVSLAFAGLGAAAVGRHLLVGRWPFPVWLLFVVLALFALLWLAVLIIKPKQA